jgi:DNA mismatch endonuclease (patch repair protein)
LFQGTLRVRVELNNWTSRFRSTPVNIAYQKHFSRPNLRRILLLSLKGGRFEGLSAARSRAMGRVRGTGNKSTEMRLRLGLVGSHIKGWKANSREVPGRPDIYFPRQRIAVFVDGCFWHACPRCFHIPRSNKKYWTKKFSLNKARDRKVNSTLRSQGIIVLRFWEHQLAQNLRKCIDQISSRLAAKDVRTELLQNE